MNTDGHDKKTNRRRLFGDLARAGLLGLIGAGAALGIGKRSKLLREGVCISDGICSRCDDLDDCGLPQARSAKMFLREGVHGG